jgi:hypothetical protein
MRVWPLLLLLGTTTGHYIRSISIYGLETEREDFVCSWAQPLEFYLDKIRELGFDSIRVPFSKQYVDKGEYSKLDNFMYQAYQRNFSIILDYHRTFNTHQGYDPFEGGTTLDQFINTWFKLLDRYNIYPNLIGHNAMNEPQGSDPQPIQQYTRALFNKIEERYPGRFIHFVTGPTWASTLRGMMMDDLPYHERIVYSVHFYPFSGNSHRQTWDWNFGNIGIPTERLIVGEFAAEVNGNMDWLHSFLDYIKEKKIYHTAYWTISASHDTYNLFADDCNTIHWDLYEILKTYWNSS